MKEGGRTESERDFEAGSQGMAAAPRSWKRQGNNLYQSPKTSSALPNPNFSPVTSALDFQRTVR